jgi:hypothetical protein
LERKEIKMQRIILSPMLEFLCNIIYLKKIKWNRKIIKKKKKDEESKVRK